MRLRAIIPAVAVAVLVLSAVALYALGYVRQYDQLMTLLGASPFRFPFLDMHGILAAPECYRRGVDVYAINPCDVFGRVHDYSPLWLYLPIDTSWNLAAGMVVTVLFIASLPLLPPGRGRWQVVVITLATISATVAYALERANNDLVLFALAALLVRLLLLGRWLRIAGYGIAVAAALL